LTRRWFEIAIPVPSGLVDEASALLDVAGFGGVEVREHERGTDVVVVVDAEDDSVDDSKHCTAEHGATWPEGLRASIAAARDAVAILGCGEPRIAELDSNVWTENWKRHFARRTFAGVIEVRPPWESAPPADSRLLSIVINPGMAFGTGLHETTAGCLELLVEQMKPGMRVADVGCGSGILAIAAARLGASHVLATDVDPLAVDATRENIDANDVAAIVDVELEPGEVGIPQWERDARPGLSVARDSAAPHALLECPEERSHPDAHRQAADVTLLHESPRPAPNGATGGGFASRGKRSFDLIVANILAETLVELRSSLSEAAADGGILVLSGIEARRLKIVEEAFIRPPWRRVRTVAKGDWISICLHNALAEPVRGLSVPGVSGGGGPKNDLPGVA